MKKAILLFVFLGIVTFGMSQKKKVSTAEMLDSMTQVLKVTKDDSTYLEALHISASIYRKKNPDTAIVLINKGIEKSRLLNENYFEARFLNQKGIYLRYNKELDSSIHYYQLAGDKFLESKDTNQYMGSFINIANVLKAQGKYEESVSNFIKGINYYEKKTDKRSQYSVMVSKFNLGALYIDLNENQKAIKVYNEILNNTLINSYKPIYTKSCINLSGVYSDVDSLDKALYYAKEAEKGTESKGSLANLYANIGNIYLKKQEFNTAISYYKKSIENAESINSSAKIINANNNLGNAYIKLKKYGKAEEYLLKSNKLLLTGNAEMSSMVVNYEMLIVANEGQKDYKGAYQNSIELKKIKDSIMGLDMKQAVLDMETKYETEKITQEKELAEANEVISNQKAESTQKRFIGAIIFAGVTALLLFFIFNRLKVIRKQKKELDEAYDMLEESKRFELADSNLKALKSQMNPHFIFNSLNSIQDLILKQDTDTSYDYIVLFAELVRNTLTYSKNEFIPFNKEVDFLKVYLELEQLRFGDDFKFTIETNGIEEIKVPSLIIQPFLENSLKHGLLHKEGLKELSLEFKMDKELTCVILDNGVGRKESERIQKRRGSKSHESFAMGAIKKRLDLLSERFEENFSFEVEDLYEYDIAKGTKITVVIPFEEEF